jgi:S1-C subfamily serine protease
MKNEIKKNRVEKNCIIKGYVLGVNTLDVRQAKGIGFAIPIEVVFEEFPDSL